MSEFDFVQNKKAKSNVWNHFWLKCNKKTKKTIESLAICRHCEQEVENSGGTTNLTSHLNRHHPYKLIKSKAENVKAQFSPAVTPAVTPPPVTPSCTKKIQGTLPGMLAAQYPFHSTRASGITRSIAN